MAARISSVRPFASAGSREDTIDAVTHVVPDHASTDEPARGQLRGRAAPRSGDLLDPFGGRAVRLHDERERADRPLAEALLEDLLRALGIGARQREAVGEEAGELGRRPAGADEDERSRRRGRPSGGGAWCASGPASLTGELERQGYASD